MSLFFAITATGLRGMEFERKGIKRSKVAKEERGIKMEFEKLHLAEEVINPNTQDEKGNTPLHRAIFKGNIEAVRALLDNPETDPNIKNHYGDAPLMMAIILNNIFNNIEIVQALLDNPKTNLNILDLLGQTPLQLAQRTYNEKLVQLIEKSTAKQEAPLEFKNLPPEIREIIIAGVADPNQKAYDTIANLHMMREVNKEFRDTIDSFIDLRIIPSSQEMKSKYFKNWLKAQYFLAYLINVISKVRHGARAESRRRFVLYLLKQERTNPDTDYGATPLEIAVFDDEPKVVKAILAHPKTTYLNTKNIYGNTPLHNAVSGNKIEIVKALLTHPKTDLDIQNYDGKTPLQYAQSRGNEKIIELLEKAIAERERKAPEEEFE